jgi:hypothetical protein
MLFCGIMFLFVCNHYIGYYREFYCILVVRRCIVIDQWKKFFNSYQCKFVLFFTELFPFLFLLYTKVIIKIELQYGI